MSVGTAMAERELVVDRYTNYPEEKVRDNNRDMIMNMLLAFAYSSLSYDNCSNVLLVFSIACLQQIHVYTQQHIYTCTLIRMCMYMYIVHTRTIMYMLCRVFCSSVWVL